MIELLIQIVVLCVVMGLIYWLVGMLPLPEPFAKIASVAVILITILLLLSLFFGLVPALKFPAR